MRLHNYSSSTPVDSAPDKADRKRKRTVAELDGGDEDSVQALVRQNKERSDKRMALEKQRLMLEERRDQRDEEQAHRDAEEAQRAQTHAIAAEKRAQEAHNLAQLEKWQQLLTSASEVVREKAQRKVEELLAAL